MNKTISTPQGRLLYEIRSEEAVLLSYEGKDGHLILPESLEDHPITSIAPKAFLGQRAITHLVLPAHLKVLGDWAFAHMTGLKILSLPARDIRLEKQVFLDCPALCEIRVQDISEGLDTTNDPALPFYLAAVIPILKNPSLFRPDLAGSREWYKSFDRAVYHLLSRPDDEGFEPVYLGWFEDEDVMATQHPAYIKKRQLEKAALSMKRLHFPIHLTKEAEKSYESYIISHFQTGVWEQFCTPEYAIDPGYLKIFMDLGCVKENNIGSLLSDLNRINSHETAEAAAMLLYYKETALLKDDFWDNLRL